MFLHFIMYQQCQAINTYVPSVVKIMLLLFYDVIPQNFDILITVFSGLFMNETNGMTQFVHNYSFLQGESDGLMEEASFKRTKSSTHTDTACFGLGWVLFVLDESQHTCKNSVSLLQENYLQNLDIFNGLHNSQFSKWNLPFFSLSLPFSPSKNRIKLYQMCELHQNLFHM